MALQLLFGFGESAFLPPLMVLLINEFGMILCLVGSWLAVKMISTGDKKLSAIMLLITNLSLAAAFAYLGYVFAVQTGVLDMIMNGGAVTS